MGSYYSCQSCYIFILLYLLICTNYFFQLKTNDFIRFKIKVFIIQQYLQNSILRVIDIDIIKQILNMNSSNPAHKPIFQTPNRQQKNNQQGQTFQKRTPNTGIDIKGTYLRDGQTNAPETITFRQSNGKIHEKTNQPYLNDRSHGYNYNNPSYQINQLLHRIRLYEQQIALLKDYIYTSDLLQRQRISDIFGFDFGCRNVAAHQESKIVLKELTIKIKHLIKQNNELRNGQGSSSSSDHLLVRENERLRKIIDQYRNSQSLQLSNAKKQNEILANENKQLEDLLLKCKSKIQLLENDMRQNQSKMTSTNTNKPIIPEIPPIREPYHTPTQQTQYAKKQLTKQMFEVENILKQKGKANDQKIQMLERRIQRLEELLKRYQKERRYKIDETMRKSFALSQNVKQIRGQDDQDPLNEDETFIRQEGKIRFTQNFFNQDQKKLNDLPNPNITKSGYIRNQAIDPNIEQTYKKETKFIHDNLAMEQLKNKNLAQQNQLLKKKLQEAEINLSQRVQRNIKLEAIISELQNQIIFLKKQGKRDPSIEKQINKIIEILKQCNIDNFDHFFKEFNQIVQQRKELGDLVQGYKNANQVLIKNSKNKEQMQKQRSILINKIDELIEENKRLIKKISGLQAEVQSYHEEIIKSQIEKLNSIKLNEGLKPTGKQALQFQHVVKDAIEQSMIRLKNLQSKIQNPNRQSQLMRISQKVQKIQKVERSSNEPRYLKLTESRQIGTK